MPINAPDINLVRKLARELPDVEQGVIHGAPSWKFKGKLLACPAIHKSAEPDSLLVKVSPEERTRLLATQPEVYYVTDHYQSDSVILVRLPKIDRKSLKALLKKSWQFLGGE
jgi:hypothetical protein